MSIIRDRGNDFFLPIGTTAPTGSLPITGPPPTPPFVFPSLGGSVMSVSVVSANGISGSVANPTTTPTITLSLDAMNGIGAPGAGLGGVGWVYFDMTDPSNPQLYWKT
jgi:hypothetical protein